MSLLITAERQALHFHIAGEAAQQLEAWLARIDAAIAETQRSTGRAPWGWDVPKEWVMIMQMAKKEGLPLPPYYGDVGGGYNYSFQVAASALTFRCTNTFTGDMLSLAADSGLSSQASEAVWTFPIEGVPYQKLTGWEHWDDAHRLTERYRYTFGPTTLGIAITVHDTVSGTTIDVTDYGDW